MTEAGPTRPAGAVVFDIDGTLVDSNYLHVMAWQRALHTTRHPVDAWRIHRAVGMGSSQLLAALLGEAAEQADQTDQTEQIGSQVKKWHRELYRQGSDLLRAFDGARELIAAVAQRGAKVVLASSAAPDELDILRSILDLPDGLAEITGAGDVEAAKPAPDLVEAAVHRAGAPRERTAFVGDTVWDVQACRKAGVPCVGVLSGGIGADELTEAGAVAVYDDCRALLYDLDNSPLATVWA